MFAPLVLYLTVLIDMATVICGNNITQLERKQLLSGGMNETGKV